MSGKLEFPGHSGLYFSQTPKTPQEQHHQQQSNVLHHQSDHIETAIKFDHGFDQYEYYSDDMRAPRRSQSNEDNRFDEIQRSPTDGGDKKRDEEEEEEEQHMSNGSGPSANNIMKTHNGILDYYLESVPSPLSDISFDKQELNALSSMQPTIIPPTSSLSIDRELIIQIDNILMDNPSELNGKNIYVHDQTIRKLKLQLKNFIGEGAYGCVFTSRTNASIVFKIEKDHKDKISGRVSKVDSARRGNVKEFDMYQLIGTTKNFGADVSTWMQTKKKKMPVKDLIPFPLVYEKLTHFEKGRPRYILTMEYLGKNLREYTRPINRLLNADVVELLSSRQFQYFSRISDQILLAFEYLHSKDIIHADFKLDNICFKRNGFEDLKHYDREIQPLICIIDFGLSTNSTMNDMQKWRDDSLSAYLPGIDASIKQQCKPVGTYLTAPLDQYFNKCLTFRGDLESAGYTIFNMLSDHSWNSSVVNPNNSQTYQFKRKGFFFFQSPLRTLFDGLKSDKKCWGKGLDNPQSKIQGAMMASAMTMKTPLNHNDQKCQLFDMIAQYFSTVYRITSRKEERTVNQNYGKLRCALDLRHHTYRFHDEYKQAQYEHFVSTAKGKFQLRTLQELIQVSREEIIAFDQLNGIQSAFQYASIDFK